MAEMGTPKEFLEEALQAVNALNSQKEKTALLKEQKETAEKLFSSLKNSLVHEKDATIVQRREELSDSFDLQIKKLESEIKSVEAKRESAKQAGMKIRIDGLRKPVNEEIKAMKNELAVLCRDENLPGICKTRLYHKLFVPTSFGDWCLIILLAAAVLVLPYFIMEVFVKKQVLKYVITAGCFLLFTVCYMAIRAATITKHPEGIKKASAIMTNIRGAKRRLYVISKEVMADKDETKYDLGTFDEEIARINGNKETVNTNKKEALLTFDTVTRDIILKEIEDRYAKDITDAENKFRELSKKYEDCVKTESDLETTVNGKYLQCIGKENLNAERLSEMADMISKGEAISITDAIQKLKR